MAQHGYVSKLFVPKLRHLALALVMVLGIFALSYLSTTNGDAFEFAREFVAHDSNVVAVTGPQRDQRLDFWSDYDYVSGDLQGTASLTLLVDGDRGKFKIPLSLSKNRGRWTVIHATVIDDKEKAVVVLDLVRAVGSYERTTAGWRPIIEGMKQVSFGSTQRREKQVMTARRSSLSNT